MCSAPPIKYALCYAHMKAHCPKILQSKCEIATPKGQPVNYWSVFCSFLD